MSSMLSARFIRISRALARHGSTAYNCLFRLDVFDAAHIGNEHIRNLDRAVGLLIILNDRSHGATNRKTGTVQRMHETVAFEVLGVLVLDVRATRLEVFAVLAGRDLLVGIV